MCVAVCCSVLQCVAVRCTECGESCQRSTLTATRYNSLQHATIHCNTHAVLHIHTATHGSSSIPDIHCITLQRTATHYNILQHTCSTPYSLQRSATHTATHTATLATTYCNTHCNTYCNTHYNMLQHTCSTAHSYCNTQALLYTAHSLQRKAFVVAAYCSALQ